MIQQVRSWWQLVPNFLCCTASETTQQLWWRLTLSPSYTNNYFWLGFHKQPSTSTWGSVSILVTPVFGHKKEFIFLNIRKVFGDLFQRSHSFASFLCNSKHLKTWLPTICNVLLWCWGKDSHRRWLAGCWAHLVAASHHPMGNSFLFLGCVLLAKEHKDDGK